MPATSADHHCLRGLITEDDLALAEREFPGITRFFETRRGRDRTFLDLVVAYVGEQPVAAAR